MITEGVDFLFFLFCCHLPCSKTDHCEHMLAGWTAQNRLSQVLCFICICHDSYEFTTIRCRHAYVSFDTLQLHLGLPLCCK